jgi:undecaprenyl pyrophosphate synthase
LYLANSAKSCAEILNIVSDQPVKLLPLLKFISNQITKSKEEASQKLLEEYYQRLFNDKDAENYAECISVLLKCGPLALQEKICLDIGEEVEKVKNFEKFAKHVSIRWVTSNFKNDFINKYHGF